MTDEDLDNIEAGVKGKLRGIPGVFVHPADTMKLVEAVRRLRAAYKQSINLAAEMSRQRDVALAESDLMRKHASMLPHCECPVCRPELYEIPEKKASAGK